MINKSMSGWVKKLLYSFLALSLISGLSFFYLNNFVTIEGTFGPEKHPWQYPILQLHGFSAFLMLLLIGAISINHVPIGWKGKRHLKSGITLASFCLVMVCSAWLLYYSGGEAFREYTSYLHIGIGTMTPVLLAIHLRARRLARIKRPK